MTNNVTFTEAQRGQFGEVFARLNNFKTSLGSLGQSFEGVGYWDELYYINGQLSALEFYLTNVYKLGTGVDIVDDAGNFVGDGAYVAALPGVTVGYKTNGGALEQPTV